MEQAVQKSMEQSCAAEPLDRNKKIYVAGRIPD